IYLHSVCSFDALKSLVRRVRIIIVILYSPATGSMGWFCISKPRGVTRANVIDPIIHQSNNPFFHKKHIFGL
ncbi:MAG TPA: hypothetical protein VJ877_04340, partial [Bacteroidales bacterium]|nr:hypothetical protein [Bacteroidales bacterium]